MKGERMAKRSSFGSIMRKRLSDISNTQSQTKLASLEEKQPQISQSTEDLINQLLMEKATLMKLVEERNKIIELSRNELWNQRMNYQKLQLQNWNLAQSNSQILAELNLGREKLKALQHELMCKDALLKAKNLEVEGKVDMNHQNTGSQGGEKIAGECLHKANNTTKPCDHSRRRTARTMGPSTTHRQVVEKEKPENKRRCLKRQSARFKSQEEKRTENFFEIEDAKFPDSRPLDNPMQEDGLTLPSSAVTKEETSEPRNEAQVAHRSSMGRPLRRAAEKVQSYKEVPLNVKMRRSE